MREIYTATYGEYLASLAGACIIAFGLGVLLANVFNNFAWLLVLLGVVIHGWGMYRTHGKSGH
jgi:hypothetical protein